jgi:hypothetical protein
MQMPTPHQVLEMMTKKFGTDRGPNAIKLTIDIAPESLVEQAMSSKMSMQSESNVLDEKTTLLIFSPPHWRRRMIVHYDTHPCGT